MSTPVRYRDIKLFLCLIPVINALNYYLTYPNVDISWHTFLTFTIDTIQGYVAWLLLRSIILLLDKKMPYEKAPVKRIFIQLVSTTVIGELAIIGLTCILNLVASDKPIPRSFYTHDIFIFLAWFFVVNGIYIGLYYYQLWNQAEQLHKKEKQLRELENKVRTEGFMVKMGKLHTQIGFDDIEVFFVDGEYTMVSTHQGKKYFADDSLDKLEKNLPPAFFFRLNRQFIVHRRVITGYSKAEYGKINIMVKGSAFLPETIQVSRTKAPAFKEWFQPAVNEIEQV